MLMNFIKQLSDGTVYLTAPVLIPYARDCDYENSERNLNSGSML